MDRHNSPPWKVGHISSIPSPRSPSMLSLNGVQLYRSHLLFHASFSNLFYCFFTYYPMHMLSRFFLHNLVTEVWVSLHDLVHCKSCTQNHFILSYILIMITIKSMTCIVWEYIHIWRRVNVSYWIFIQLFFTKINVLQIYSKTLSKMSMNGCHQVRINNWLQCSTIYNKIWWINSIKVTNELESELFSLLIWSTIDIDHQENEMPFVIHNKIEYKLWLLCYFIPSSAKSVCSVDVCTTDH